MARIIFLTDFSEAYARGLLLGIARYAHDTGQAWSLCRLPLSIRDKFGIEAVIDWALRMRADAVIGQFYNTDNVELFARNGIIAVAQELLIPLDIGICTISSYSSRFSLHVCMIVSGDGCDVDTSVFSSISAS